MTFKPTRSGLCMSPFQPVPGPVISDCCLWENKLQWNGYLCFTVWCAVSVALFQFCCVVGKHETFFPPKSLYLTLAEIACYSLVGLSNLTIILNSDTVTTQLVSDSPKVGDCLLFPSAPSFVSLLLLSPEN